MLQRRLQNPDYSGKVMAIFCHCLAFLPKDFAKADQVPALPHRSIRIRTHRNLLLVRVRGYCLLAFAGRRTTVLKVTLQTLAVNSWDSVRQRHHRSAQNSSRNLHQNHRQVL